MATDSTQTKQRKPYVRPELVVHGTVRELTGGAEGLGSDASGVGYAPSG